MRMLLQKAFQPISWLKLDSLQNKSWIRNLSHLSREKVLHKNKITHWEKGSFHYSLAQTFRKRFIQLYFGSNQTTVQIARKIRNSEPIKNSRSHKADDMLTLIDNSLVCQKRAVKCKVMFRGLSGQCLNPFHGRWFCA